MVSRFRIFINNVSATWFQRNNKNTSATWFRREYRLWQPWRNKILVFGVLSLAPCYVRKKAGTCSWSDCISSPNTSSFVGHALMNGAVAPCMDKHSYGSFPSMQMSHTHTHIYIWYVYIYIYMHTYACMILHSCFRRIGGLIGLESHFCCWNFPTFRSTEANPIHGVPRHLRHPYSEAGRTGRCAVCSRSPLVEGQQNLTTWRIQKYA